MLIEEIFRDGQKIGEVEHSGDDVVGLAGDPIAEHALALKIGAVNAIRTDGGPDYPVTAEALKTIRERYSDIVQEASAKTLLGETLTDAEKATIALIKAGFDFFQLVDTAADAIRAAADAADPLASDSRWPVAPDEVKAFEG